MGGRRLKPVRPSSWRFRILSDDALDMTEALAILRPLQYVVVALAVFSASPLAGQSRHGLEVGFGVGASSVDIGDPKSAWVPGLHADVGVAVTPMVSLRVKGSEWPDEREGRSLSFVGHIYPRPSSGLFIEGGIAWTEFQYEAGHTEYGSPGVVVGLGYDKSLCGDRIVITYLADFTVAVLGFRVAELGMGLSWR